MKALTFAASALGLTSAAGLTPTAPGGATQSLLDSIARAVLVAAIVWQTLMIAVSFIAIGAAGWPLALVNLVVAALAAVVWPRQRLRWVLPVSVVAAGVFGYVTSGDIDAPLTFAACWQINFATCYAGLIVLRRSVVPLVLSYATAAAASLVILVPQWGLTLPISIITTQTLIIVALRLGIASLLRHSTRVDESVRAADDADIRSVTLGYHSARLAEESRALHDTAVNTFAAIATAGAGVRNHEQVRAQCARDAEVLAELRGLAQARSDAALLDIFVQPGLPIRRHGVSDAAAERLSETLPPDVIDAVVGCVREAVTNATKHSGAALVDIELAETEAEIVVQVRDAGVGFAVDTTTTRGIGASILARARDYGFSADVSSEVGAGTTVTLTIARSVAEDAGVSGTNRAEGVSEAPRALEQSAAEIRRRSGSYWGIGVALVGVVLILAGGTNLGGALWIMIAVMLAAVALTLVTQIRDSWVGPGLMIVAAVVVFVLSAAATGFGQVAPIHWQALAPSGPFVLLLSITANRWWRGAGWISVAAAVTIVGAIVMPTSPSAAGLVVIAGLVGLGFSALWARFQVLIDQLTAVASAAAAHRYRVRLHNELEIASQAAFRRWIDAGLDDAAALLRDIAAGRLDLNDAATRARTKSVIFASSCKSTRSWCF